MHLSSSHLIAFFVKTVYCNESIIYSKWHFLKV
ncbi:hypothetical protein CPL0016902_CDS0036 [Escherichia phage tunus]|nr:hypothetical protein G3B1_062 [Escherichia phage vB_EcoS-G3B1]WQN06689.1 hypothetical protein [Escherichia phage vB-Eco-KMB46]DAJ87583.1 MAG TPA: hypothetical protein [Bacteriophage sp.]